MTVKSKTIIFSVTGALLLVGIIYLSFNWKSLLLRYSGFENPKIESAKTVKEFVKSQDIKYHILAIANSKEAYSKLEDSFKIPGIIIFNRDLRPIISSNGKGCQRVARSRLSELSSADNLPVDSSGIQVQHLSEILSEVEIIDGDQAILSKALNAGYDYVAVYSWAKFFKDNSIEMMHACEKGLENADANILVISLNLDINNRWRDGEVGEKVPIEL